MAFVLVFLTAMSELTIKEVLKQSGIGDDPELYRGKPAALVDLSGERLESVYRGIIVIGGQSAGTGFMTAVRRLPDLSASRFIEITRRLADVDWDPDAVLTNDLDSQDSPTEMIGETDQIRRNFREVHAAMREAAKCIDESNWLLAERPN